MLKYSYIYAYINIYIEIFKQTTWSIFFPFNFFLFFFDGGLPSRVPEMMFITVSTAFSISLCTTAQFNAFLFFFFFAGDALIQVAQIFFLFVYVCTPFLLILYGKKKKRKKKIIIFFLSSQQNCSALFSFLLFSITYFPYKFVHLCLFWFLMDFSFFQITRSFSFLLLYRCCADSSFFVSSSSRVESEDIARVLFLPTPIHIVIYIYIYIYLFTVLSISV